MFRKDCIRKTRLKRYCLKLFDMSILNTVEILKVNKLTCNLMILFMLGLLHESMKRNNMDDSSLGRLSVKQQEKMSRKPKHSFLL